MPSVKKIGQVVRENEQFKLLLEERARDIRDLNRELDRHIELLAEGRNPQLEQSTRLGLRKWESKRVPSRRNSQVPKLPLGASKQGGMDKRSLFEYIEKLEKMNRHHTREVKQLEAKNLKLDKENQRLKKKADMLGQTMTMNMTGVEWPEESETVKALVSPRRQPHWKDEWVVRGDHEEEEDLLGKTTVFNNLSTVVAEAMAEGDATLEEEEEAGREEATADHLWMD